jgi:UDP-3-O-[3-hydroxymyristoyl] glucosamine N-acyltransferase
MKLKAYQVAEIVGGDVEGNDQVSIDSLAKIENGKEGSLSFLGNPKYKKFLDSSKSSIVIVADNFVSDKNLTKTLIKVKDPNEAFSKLLDLFGNQTSSRSGIDKLSSVDNTVSIGKDVYLGAFSICEKDSIIGKNCKIYSQVYVGENVKIVSN